MFSVDVLMASERYTRLMSESDLPPGFSITPQKTKFARGRKQDGGRKSVEVGVCSAYSPRGQC